MQDAFMAGVEPGGLNNTQEIKILLCYMLHSVGQPINRDEVLDIILTAGMANYFDTENAIEELLRLGHLTQDENKMLAVSNTGGRIGNDLSVRVPYTLRERSVKAALQLLKRHRIEEENKVEIRRLEGGGYEVTCTVLDGDRPLMATTLRVGDEWQANAVKENFLSDPALLYRSSLAVLTGDTVTSRIGTQLVIELS